MSRRKSLAGIVVAAVAAVVLASPGRGQTALSPPGAYTIQYQTSGSGVRSTLRDPNRTVIQSIQFAIGDRLTIRPAQASTGDRIGRSVRVGSYRYKSGEHGCGPFGLGTCSEYTTAPADDDEQRYTAWDDFGPSLQLQAEGRARNFCLHAHCSVAAASLGPTMSSEGLVYVAATSGTLRALQNFFSPPRAFQNCSPQPTSEDVALCESRITQACQGREECARADGEFCRIECGTFDLTLEIVLERP